MCSPHYAIIILFITTTKYKIYYCIVSQSSLYSIQRYALKFVSDFACGMFEVFSGFSTINTGICDIPTNQHFVVSEVKLPFLFYPVGCSVVDHEFIWTWPFGAECYKCSLFTLFFLHFFCFVMFLFCFLFVLIWLLFVFVLFFGTWAVREYNGDDDWCTWCFFMICLLVFVSVRHLC